jgi:hypothetical protein
MSNILSLAILQFQIYNNFKNRDRCGEDMKVLGLITFGAGLNNEIVFNVFTQYCY